MNNPVCEIVVAGATLKTMRRHIPAAVGQKIGFRDKIYEITAISWNVDYPDGITEIRQNLHCKATRSKRA